MLKRNLLLGNCEQKEYKSEMRLTHFYPECGKTIHSDQILDTLFINC